MENKKEDPVNPSYYSDGISTTDYILSKKLGYLEGNVIKYLTRHEHKNGVEDLFKAKWYLEKLIDKYVNKK